MHMHMHFTHVIKFFVLLRCIYYHLINFYPIEKHFYVNIYNFVL